jgi:hypothetical protein
MTYDIQYLWRLSRSGDLTLRPEFQRDSVWPVAAKSYFIDTLIRGLPSPLVFVHRTASPDTGRAGLAVIDGQQRLSAAFDYVEGKYRLSGEDVQEFSGRRFAQLPARAQEAILGYGVIVEELEGHSPSEVRDIFARLNKYGVRLAPQELRHAREDGAFKRVVEEVGSWEFWTEAGIVTPAKARRMRSDELSAELLILLAEGSPQDKKRVIDEYYVKFVEAFPESQALVDRLHRYTSLSADILPQGRRTRFRKAVDFYSLIGAIDQVTDRGSKLEQVPVADWHSSLTAFEGEVRMNSTSRADRYSLAASRQTDNVRPRATRIEILASVLGGEL